MGNRSITQFKIDNNIYGFYYGSNGEIEGQGYICLKYLKALQNPVKREYFINRIKKVNFCDDLVSDTLEYDEGNEIIDFLLNSDDNQIVTDYNRISKCEDILHLSLEASKPVYNYTKNSRFCYTYLIDLDKNTFFIKEDYPIEISNIEIPKEYWENEKLLDYYNKTHREVTLMQLRNEKTDCIMEKDVKKWFFDKYDSGCDIIEFIKEQNIKNNFIEIILGDKIHNKDYVNQCVLEIRKIDFSLRKNSSLSMLLANHDITSMDEILLFNLVCRNIFYRHYEIFLIL